MGEEKRIPFGLEYQKGWYSTVNDNQRDTIRRMLAKARDKIETAESLLEAGKFDDSASRAYYAVFYAISAALFSKGLAFSSHAQVIGAFNREFVKGGAFPSFYTMMIKRLFDDRQTGDYDFDSWIDEQTAREDIENAETIISGIEEYLNTLSTEKE
jgi:uncharacterized protein (UPF0332 family)